MRPRSLLPCLLAAAAVHGCADAVHPLDREGSVVISSSVDEPLYGVLAVQAPDRRQSPHSAVLSLALTEGGEPAYGAYVDVSVNPPVALRLGDVDGSCTSTAGVFRCTATSQGQAKLSVDVDGDWSGEAVVTVSWTGASEKRTLIVKPPGLPSDTGAFRMIVGDGESRVRPSYRLLRCVESTGAPAETSALEPRAIAVRISATPPLRAPGVIENAPVAVNSTTPNVTLSLDPDCKQRTAQRVVQLDAQGNAPDVWACVDVRAGTAALQASSGELGAPPGAGAQIVVDAEPKSLRIRAMPGASPRVDLATALFEVNAFDVDDQPLALSVDLAVLGPVSLGFASVLLPGTQQGAPIQGLPTAAGSVIMSVWPTLHPEKACRSEVVKIVSAP